MFYGELSTSECTQEIDFDFGPQIVFLPLESFMWLLFDDNDHIPRNRVRRLVALTRESDVLTTSHPLVNVDLEHLLLLNSLLAGACFASVFVVDNLALTAAVAARLLNLLNHRTHLANDHPNTATTARGALLDSAFLPAMTIALRANNIASESELRSLALV